MLVPWLPNPLTLPLLNPNLTFLAYKIPFFLLEKANQVIHQIAKNWTSKDSLCRRRRRLKVWVKVRTGMRKPMLATALAPLRILRLRSFHPRSVALSKEHFGYFGNPGAIGLDSSWQSASRYDVTHKLFTRQIATLSLSSMLSPDKKSMRMDRTNRMEFGWKEWVWVHYWVFVWRIWCSFSLTWDNFHLMKQNLWIRRPCK